ncbi:hypothetical protein SAMN05892883_3090 [Jatrophihabitans sp. GAS493]|nr:hypothetical protein SAMN05892883_3090 [Jatrophihabitans sp. GAS493]
MLKVFSRRVLVVVSFATCSMLAAFSAWAYWSTQGTTIGSATGTTSTLTAPVVTATAGSAQTSLSWTASTGASPIAYLVTRTNTATSRTAPACGGAPISATTCTDPVPAGGTYTYTVTATAGSWTAAGAASAPVSIVGIASRLAFTTQPGGGIGGVALATQPVVTVQDTAGNTVNSTAPVTLTLTTVSGGPGTLAGCTAPVTAVAGVATFTGCRVDTLGTYTLTAASTGLTADTSSDFSIGVGSATRLTFTTQPGNGTGGVALSPQPVVTIQDGGGNTVNSNAAVTLTLTTPAGATLTCTANPVNAVAGVATFAGCRVDKAGTYTLTATGLTTPATSSTFTIGVGPVAKLAFTTQPGNGTGGVALATQPVVTVQDAGGNTVTTSTASVALALATPAGATLTCTANPVNAVAGVATFAGCRVDKVGTYALTATSAGLTTAMSSTFTVSVGTAAKLAFTTQPGNGTGTGTGRSTLVTQPVVTVQDVGGNTVTTSTATVTLTLNTITGGPGTLTGCTTPVNAVAGVATFTGCAIDKTGTYNLTATSAGLTSATSTIVTVATGAATKLAFSTQPGNGTGGIALARQPVVTIEDTGGNTVNSTAGVSLTLTTPGGATLTCTANPVNAVAGVASFAGCKVDKSGTYTLTAASIGVVNAISTTFTISVGPAAKLAFTTQPGNGTGGVALTTQPVVTIQDAGGNSVTTSAAGVTLALTTPAGATLTCAANPLNATAGVATFTGCRVDKAGTYTLTAASTGLTAATSSSLTVTAPVPTKLAFTTQPGNGTGGIALPTQPVVKVQDASGNTVTTSTAGVTLALTTPAGATLTCTANPVNAAAGVASFTGCRVNKVGTYTLTATSAGLTNATSSTFTVIAGPVVGLAWTNYGPSTTTCSTLTPAAGPSTSVSGVLCYKVSRDIFSATVSLVDAGGNIVANTTGDRIEITLNGNATVPRSSTSPRNVFIASGATASDEITVTVSLPSPWAPDIAWIASASGYPGTATVSLRAV